jgi:parallel beta-helix repeat protein
MKQFFTLTAMLILLFSGLNAQNFLYQEGFEGTPAVTSGGTPLWTQNTAYFANGTKSYLGQIVVPGDSSVLITNAFSTLGAQKIILEFSHICKIEFLDAAEIYVSNNNGTTWTKLTDTQYQGSGTFNATTGYGFSSATYQMWVPGTQATPANSWWMDEVFNISALVANSAQVRIMFMLRDMNNGTQFDNWGWLLDDIKVWTPSPQAASINGIILPLSLPSGCGLTNETIQVRIANEGGQNINGNLTATFKREGQLAVTESVPTLIAPDDTITYTFTNKIDLSSLLDTTYEVKAWITLVGDNNQNNDTTMAVFDSKIALIDPAINDTTIPFGTSVTFTAYHTDSITWYSDPLAMNLLQKGSSFTTPILFDTALFYVQAGNPGTQTNYVGPPNPSIGTISSTNLTNHFVIFDVLNANGITLEAFDMYPTSSVGSPFTIIVQNSAQQQIASYSGVTTTTGGVLQTVVANLNVPFGTGYRLGFSVNPGFNRNTTGAVYPYTVPGEISITGNTFNVVYAYFFYNWKVTSGGGVTGCPSRVVPVKVSISGIPQYNAGIVSITSPVGPYTQGSIVPVTVNLKNFASDTLKKVTIHYSVNGVTKAPYLWTGNLPYNQIASVTIATDTFVGGAYTYRAWTSMPNDSVDGYTANDSAMAMAYVCLSGNFTLGGANADFPDFASLFTILNNVGICGPTTVTLTAGLPPFTGGMEIGSIQGSSPQNTLTIDGNGNTITQGAVTYILAFNGAKHITITGFNLVNTTPSSNIFGVMIRGASQYITLDNNTINVGITSTSSLSAGIAVSNSITSATTTGNNGQYLTITNNTIIGGYYGITLMGLASYLNCYGNLVADNIVRDYYLYGIYLSNNDTTIVRGNDISRPTRTTLSTFYGIYATTTRNTKYIGNRIHTSGIGSYTAYPIYLTTSSNTIGYETELINNAIYNIQTTGTLYAMYILGTNNAINIYYNSINLNTTGSTGAVRAMFFSTAPNNYKLRNNILHIDGTGSGAKFCIYVTTASATFSSDYNNFHMGATAGTNNFGYWAANQLAFTNWKTATSQDANSLNIPTPYNSTTDFTLANTLLSAKGIAIPGVTTDIFGTNRGPVPTIGAQEIPLIAIDAGVLNIVAPTPQSGIAEGDNVPVIVRVQNFGSDTLTSFDVFYRVNQGVPVQVAFNGQLLPLQITQVTMPSYVAPAGNTQLCAYTVLPGDSNTFNDTACMAYYATPLTDAYLKSIAAIPGGCGLGLDTVRVLIRNIGALPISGGFNISYQVLGSSVVVNQLVANTIAVNDSLVIAFNTPVDLFTSNDSLFTIKAWVTLTGDNVQYNDTANLQVNSYAIPPVPVVVTPATTTYATSALISATSATTILWYPTLTATTPVGVGNNYQTPILYDTTVFYATSRSSMNCESAKVPLTVFVTGFPPVDAGVVTILNPAGSALSGVLHPIQVELKNFGLNTLVSAQIVWSLNNVIQDTIPWTGNLVHGATEAVTIDSAIFLTGNHCITAYSILPNSVADPVSSNDAATMCFYACMGGVYTIGPATSGTYDYNSFNAALTALSSTGPCGQVIFDVYPGTYTEQLNIAHILNSDLNNTIMFRGVTGDSTDVVLQFAATSSTDNWVVRMNGGSFFTWKHITFRATGASNGRVFEFLNGSSRVTIANCRVESSTTSTSSTFAGIYSTTSSNIHHLTVTNSVIKGGYYGIYWYGSSAMKKNGFNILNNVIEDYYYYGIYTYYADSVMINGNQMTSRATAGVLYPLYVGYTTGYGEVTRNNITSTGSSTHYGLYIGYKQAASSVPMLVANNMLTQSGNLTGTVYGMYVIGSNYVNVYHNTIRIAGGSATAGRALYQSTGAGVNFVNNIFSNHNGGFAYYVNTPSGVGTSNHNNYYSTASTLAYWGSNANTLAALRTANSQDLNSHDFVPPYVGANDLHLSTTLLSAKGTPIASVPTDIDGDPRAPLPTIGADEIPLVEIDAGISAILTPPILTNEGQVYPVEVTLTNFGTDTLFALDIEYSVNNGTPVTVPWTGTLASFGSINVTLPSMTSPAGNSAICVKTVLAADSNLFNNQMCKNFFGTPLKDAKVVEVLLPEDGCGLALDTVSIMITNLGVDTINAPVPSVITANYKVAGGSVVVTENVAQVIWPGDTVKFTFQTPNNFAVTTGDSLFEIVAWVSLTGDNVQYNDTAVAEVLSLWTPPPPVVSDTTIPYGTSITLNAISQDSVFWYASDTASADLHQGANFATPVLYTNTTYWVEAVSGGMGSGANIALTALSAHSGGGATTYGPANYNDGIISNYGVLPWGWVTTNGWIEYTWTTPMTFNAVKFYKDNRPMSSCTFQYWDGANYVNFYSYNSTVIDDSVTFPPVTSTRLRFNAIAGSSNPNFREIQVFEPKQTGCKSVRVPLLVTVSNQSTCDVGVAQIIQPNTATNLGAMETVRISVTNYGTQAQSNIPVSFKVDQLPAVTETMAGPIPPNTSMDYIFTSTANLAVAGTTYQIKAWTGLSCDITHQNDTAWKSVTNLLPVYCNSTATSASYSEITNVTLGTMSHTSPSSGAMYSNHTATVLPPMLSPGVSYTMSVTSSFAPGSTTSYTCWVKAWIDFNRDGTFDPLTEEVLSSTTTNNNTVTVTIQIPFAAMNGNTVMRVVLNQTSSATSVNPCGTYTYGETEDYMVTIAPQAPCDAGVIQIISPQSLTQSGIALPVWIKFMNFGSDPIPAGNLSIAYKLNNGTPVVMPYAGVMAPGAIDSILMGTVTLPIGNNTLCAYTILACDSNAFNNEICKGIYGQYQTTLPYFDDFETSNMWYKPVTSVNWQYGTPSGSIISTAYSGNKAWVTNLTGDYSNNANEHIYTPIFSFAGLGGTDTITLSFYHFLAMAASDYGRVQYTIDGGQTWSNLGFFGDPMGTNWYNTQVGGVHYFSLTNTGWMYSAYKLSPNTFNGQLEVQFRFNLVTNASVTSNGWAIDNFRLALPLVPNDVGISAIQYPLNDTAMGSQVYAKVTLSNFGTNAQTMIPILLKLNGTVVSTETWTGMLAGQSTTTYDFILPFTVPGAAYQLCAETQLTGDAFPSNDGKCEAFTPLPAYHDVGIIQILSPTTNATGDICFFDPGTHPWYHYDVTVRLENTGQNAQTSVPIRYTFFNGGPVFNETWLGNLAPNTYVDIPLGNQFMAKLGAQQVCVETALIGDGVPGNNKSCKTYNGITCIGIDDQVASQFSLGQNIPNPASFVTVITWNLPEQGEVTFGLVSMVGQVLHSEVRSAEAGMNQLDLDVSELAAGVYYYFIEYNGQRLTRKMLVSR